MASYTTRRSHAGPVPRRAGLVLPAVACLAVALALVGCNLSTPTEPDPSLTGTTPNQDISFSGTITLTSSSPTVPADDVTTVTITAVVRDASGRPVQNLTPVLFSTDVGQFLTEGGGTRVAEVGTFNGQASVAFSSFDRVSGTATVSATVGNVTQTLRIELEVAPVAGFVDLTFADGGTIQDGTVSPITPFRTPIQAVASDTDGDPLAGVLVRFRIVEDDSTGSGRGGARFEGFAETRTNSAGEATNQLIVFGEGRVIVEADLVDPNTGDVVSTSNQIILVTREPDNAGVIIVSLTVDGGSTLTAAAPFSADLTATVERDGEPILGAIVRFSLQGEGDPPPDPDGTLANTGTNQTDVNGQVVNILNVADTASVGDSWGPFAEVIDSGGAVIAKSPKVIVTVGTDEGDDGSGG